MLTLANNYIIIVLAKQEQHTFFSFLYEFVRLNYFLFLFLRVAPNQLSLKASP